MIIHYYIHKSIKLYASWSHSSLPVLLGLYFEVVVFKLLNSLKSDFEFILQRKIFNLKASISYFFHLSIYLLLKLFFFDPIFLLFDMVLFDFELIVLHLFFGLLYYFLS